MKLILSLSILGMCQFGFAQDLSNQKIADVQAENNAKRIEAEAKRAEIINQVNERRAQLEQIRAGELERAQQLKIAAQEGGN